MLTGPVQEFTTELLRSLDLDRSQGKALVFALGGSDGRWVDACAGAGDAVLEELCAPDGPESWIIRTIARYGPPRAGSRALAVCHAARAARLGEAGREEQRRAAELWAGDGTGDVEIADLVRRFRGEHTGGSATTRITVLLRAREPEEWGHLYAETVTGFGEQVWPGPAAMTFAPVRPHLREAAERAFRWARAHEDFTPGTGVRWWLTTDGNRPASTRAPIAAAMAAAMVHDRFDPRIAILAEMEAGGRLLPVGPVPAIGTGRIRTLLTAGGQEPGTAGETVRQRTVHTVEHAARAARQSRPWRLAAGIAAVTVVVAMLAGAAFWQVSEVRAARERTAFAGRLAAEARTERPSQRAGGLRKALAAAAVRPDLPAARDALMATALADLRCLRLLDIGPADGRRRVVVDTHGTRVVVLDDRGAGLWDIATGQRLPLDSAAGSAVTTAAFSAGGQLVTGSADGALTVFDTSGRVAVRRTVRPAPAGVTVNPRGDVVAVGDSGGTVTLYDLADLKPGRALRTTAANTVSALAFSADGNRLAATGTGGRVHTWRIDGTEPLSAALPGPGTYVDFDEPDAVVRVFSGRDTLSVLAAADLKVRREAPSGVADPGLARWGTGGLLVAANNGVTEVDTGHRATGPLRQSSEAAFAHGALVDNVIATSADGERLVTQLDEGTLGVFGDVIVEPPRWPARSQMVDRAWDLPGGQRQLVVTGWVIGATQVWVVDRETGAALRPPVSAGGTRSTARSAYSPGQRLLAIPRESEEVRLWSVAGDGALTELPPLRRDDSQVPTAVAFDDVHRLMFVGYRQYLVTYDMADPGAPKQRLEQRLPRIVTCLSVDPAATAVVVCGPGGLRRLPLDANGLPSGDAIAAPLVDSRRVDDAVAMSASAVVTGSRNGTSHLYRESAGRWQIIPLEGPGGVSAAVAAVGDVVVSGGDGGKLVISDADTGETVVTSEMGVVLRVPSISTAGTTIRIHALGGGGRMDLDLSPAAVHRRACDLLGTGSARMTVADAEPGAASEYRDLPLCPPSK